MTNDNRYNENNEEEFDPLSESIFDVDVESQSDDSDDELESNSSPVLKRHSNLLRNQTVLQKETAQLSNKTNTQKASIKPVVKPIKNSTRNALMFLQPPEESLLPIEHQNSNFWSRIEEHFSGSKDSDEVLSLRTGK